MSKKPSKPRSLSEGPDKDKFVQELSTICCANKTKMKTACPLHVLHDQILSKYQQLAKNDFDIMCSCGRLQIPPNYNILTFPAIQTPNDNCVGLFPLNDMRVSSDETFRLIVTVSDGPNHSRKFCIQMMVFKHATFTRNLQPKLDSFRNVAIGNAIHQLMGGNIYLKVSANNPSKKDAKRFGCGYHIKSWVPSYFINKREGESERFQFTIAVRPNFTGEISVDMEGKETVPAGNNRRHDGERLLFCRRIYDSTFRSGVVNNTSRNPSSSSNSYVSSTVSVDTGAADINYTTVLPSMAYDASGQSAKQATHIDSLLDTTSVFPASTFCPPDFSGGRPQSISMETHMDVDHTRGSFDRPNPVNQVYHPNTQQTLNTMNNPFRPQNIPQPNQSSFPMNTIAQPNRSPFPIHPQMPPYPNTMPHPNVSPMQPSAQPYNRFNPNGFGQNTAISESQTKSINQARSFANQFGGPPSVMETIPDFNSIAGPLYYQPSQQSQTMYPSTVLSQQSSDETKQDEPTYTADDSRVTRALMDLVRSNLIDTFVNQLKTIRTLNQVTPGYAERVLFESLCVHPSDPLKISDSNKYRSLRRFGTLLNVIAYESGSKLAFYDAIAAQFPDLYKRLLFSTDPYQQKTALHTAAMVTPRGSDAFDYIFTMVWNNCTAADEPTDLIQRALRLRDKYKNTPLMYIVIFEHVRILEKIHSYHIIEEDDIILKGQNNSIDWQMVEYNRSNTTCFRHFPNAKRVELKRTHDELGCNCGTIMAILKQIRDYNHDKEKREMEFNKQKRKQLQSEFPLDKEIRQLNLNPDSSNEKKQ